MATSRYVIEGNLVTREDYTRGPSLPLDTLLADLTAYQPLDLNHVPKGLRAIRAQPDGNTDGEISLRMLIEQEPKMRRITYKNCSASRQQASHVYNIQLPYVFFWIHLKGSKVHSATGERTVWSPLGWGQLWGKEPYRGWETPALTPHFPNIFGDSRICFGAVRQNPEQSLGHYVDASINGYWTSEFNRDVDWSGPVGDGSIAAWQNREEDWMQWDIWQNLNPLRGYMEGFSTNFNFTEPMPADAGDNIPRVPIIQTFNNVQGWLAAMEPQQRERIMWAAAHYDEVQDD